jgi:spore coat polysaccharide biosynthesis protein SpsF
MDKSSIKLVTVIQARISSTRLPGKVLLPLAGRPLLLRLINRVQAAKHSGCIVVATTISPIDDDIEKLCEDEGIHCYRGHPEDLLDRHYQVGVKYKADAVVKIPSDVPLIDPGVIDKVLQVYLENPRAIDYASNLHPATYPDGNDVEVISMWALKKAWLEAFQSFEREHTTPFIWERPDQFRLVNVEWESGLNYSMSHRWTIDYAEDYSFIKAVFEELYPQNRYFSLDDILDLLRNRPELMTLNSSYAGVNWYRHHLEDLKTVDVNKTRNEPEYAANHI